MCTGIFKGDNAIVLDNDLRAHLSKIRHLCGSQLKLERLNLSEHCGFNSYFEQNLGDILFGAGESVLTLLYKAYAESNKMDDGAIKEDFNELNRLMNGMELREMDRIIYPVCTLCRDHQRVGFEEGVKIGTCNSADSELTSPHFGGD